MAADIKPVQSLTSRLRRVASIGLVVACLAPWLGPATDARADSVDQANAQAQKIAAGIRQLQPRVDAALAAYDASLSVVGQSVTGSVATREVYAQLDTAADALEAQRDSHVTALYESGGPLGLYADVLESGHPGDLHQVQYLQGLLDSDAAEAAAARQRANAAQTSLNANQTLINTSLANADVVDQQLTTLQTLLAQQQALLDQASAKARNLQAIKDAAAALAASQAEAAADAAAAAAQAIPYPIPPLYRALDQAAATTCPGLSWTVLAAIGQVETHFGSGTMVSSAGALGPMQFLPATFAEYARDGDHDGVANIMDPADAIYTAAAYLCANGAGQGGQSLYNAIWNYNHADWYVQLVLALAAKIT